MAATHLTPNTLLALLALLLAPITLITLLPYTYY